MANIGIRSKGGMQRLPSLTWLTLFVVGMFCALPTPNSATTPTAPTKDFATACQVQFNVTEDELREFPEEPNPDEVDLKFKCYANCLLQNMGLVDDRGRLDAEAMHESGILTEDSYESVLECKAAIEMEDDLCEYSFGLMLCVRMIHQRPEEDASGEVESIEEERRK